jgi:hypothetical protein
MNIKLKLAQALRLTRQTELGSVTTQCQEPGLLPQQTRKPSRGKYFIGKPIVSWIT